MSTSNAGGGVNASTLTVSEQLANISIPEAKINKSLAKNPK